MKTPVAVILLFLVTTTPVFAETYSNTITKDGKTYVTTKTVNGAKMTIETKVYDSSGTLLKTEVVTKDIDPTPVKTGSETYPTKSPTTIPSVKPTAKPTTQPSSKSEITPTPPPAVPEAIVQKAKAAGLDTVEETGIATQSGNRMVYQIKGTKYERFLALVQIKLQTILTYNSQTGQLEKTEQTLGTKILDFLSL